VVKRGALSSQRLHSSAFRLAHLSFSAAFFALAARAAYARSCSACSCSAACCSSSAAWYISFMAIAAAAAAAAALPEAGAVELGGCVRCLRGWRMSAGALAARLEPAVALWVLERPRSALLALCCLRSVRYALSAACCASAAVKSGSIRLSISSRVSKSIWVVGVGGTGGDQGDLGAAVMWVVGSAVMVLCSGQNSKAITREGKGERRGDMRSDVGTCLVTLQWHWAILEKMSYLRYV
jgi:hypothetical protein